MDSSMQSTSNGQQEDVHLKDASLSLAQFRLANLEEQPARSFSRTQQLFIMLYDIIDESPFLVDPSSVTVQLMDGMPFGVEIDPKAHPAPRGDALRSLGFAVDWLLSGSKHRVTSVEQWITERKSRAQIYPKATLTLLDQLIFVPENASVDTSSKMGAFVAPEPDTEADAEAVANAPQQPLLESHRAARKAHYVLFARWFVIMGLVLLCGVALGSNAVHCSNCSEQRRDLGRLEGKLQQARHHIRNLSGEVDALRQARAEAVAQIQQRAHENLDLQNQVSALTSALNSEKRRSSQLAGSAQQATIAGDWKAEALRSRQQLAQAAQSVRHWDATKQEYRREIGTLKSALQAERNAHQKQKQKRHRCFPADLDAMRVENAQLKQQVGRLEQVHEANRENYGTIMESLSEAREQVAALSKRNTQLERAEGTYPRVLRDMKEELQKFVDSLVKRNFIKKRIDCSASNVGHIVDELKEQLGASFAQAQQATRDIRQDYDSCARELYRKVSGHNRR